MSCKILATCLTMTNSTNAERADREITAAYKLDDDIARAKLNNDDRRVGRVAAVQRTHMKRAEIHALMAIRDELVRIGFSR